MSLRVLVLCTLSTGLDAVAEVLRIGSREIVGIVGVDPARANPDVMSGYVDIRGFCEARGIASYLVQSYALSAEQDRELLSSLNVDLIWVAGWQRLVPDWLIARAKNGVIGLHGSPDGISGGRGRSPQNWALLLGCRQFDLALFRITPNVDDGPVVATRSFFYRGEDDIAVSYLRVALATAEMVTEVLTDPACLDRAKPQAGEARYLPQRRPEDGRADWHLGCGDLVRHVRALAHPYPGLATADGDHEISLWKCQVFDDVVDAAPGTISAAFLSGDFLVTCRDGRLLIRRWSSRPEGWQPKVGTVLESVRFDMAMRRIVDRHRQKSPDQPLTRRLQKWVDLSTDKL